MLKQAYFAVVSFFVLLDLVIFFLSYFALDKFGEIFPQYLSSDERYPRLVGAFFLMCAIARFHGVINSNEKGAYRVFLWSCIIEFFYHAYEMSKETMEKKKVIPVLVITGVATIWGSLLYRSVLKTSPTDAKRK